MAILPNQTIANFLNISILENTIFSLDLWSIIHLISGFIIMWIIYKFSNNIFINYIILIILLVLYEFFEICFYGTLFREESNLNIIWDIIIGLFGAIIFIFSIRKN